MEFKPTLWKIVLSFALIVFALICLPPVSNCLGGLQTCVPDKHFCSFYGNMSYEAYQEKVLDTCLSISGLYSTGDGSYQFIQKYSQDECRGFISNKGNKLPTDVFVAFRDKAISLDYPPSSCANIKCERFPCNSFSLLFLLLDIVIVVLFYVIFSLFQKRELYEEAPRRK